MLSGFGTAIAAPSTETIVLVRHGEKPAAGLGQLTCQGLNRALALPAVIKSAFGKPDIIFAPNPGEAKPDGGVSYNYIRPLATIEPTAIAFGMPVDTSLGLSKIEALQQRLDDKALHGAFVLVAWEHWQLVDLTRNIVAAHGGDRKMVPDWKGSDFDGIYVLKITREGAASKIAFERKTEGLNGQPTACPGG